MTESINESKVLYIVGIVLFAMFGWMFNKIMGEMEALREEVDKLNISAAVIEYQIEDCKEEP